MTHRSRERGWPTGLLTLCLSGLLLMLAACGGADGISGDVVTGDEVQVAKSTSGLSAREGLAICCFSPENCSLYEYGLGQSCGPSTNLCYRYHYPTQTWSFMSCGSTSP